MIPLEYNNQQCSFNNASIDSIYRFYRCNILHHNFLLIPVSYSGSYSDLMGTEWNDESSI